MTGQQGFPAPGPTPGPSTNSVGGAVLSVVLASLVLGVPILVAVFAALVAYNGCLFCTEDQPPEILPTVGFGVLAVVLVAMVVLCGVAGYRRWRQPWPWLAMPIVLVLAVLAGLSFGL